MGKLFRVALLSAAMAFLMGASEGCGEEAVQCKEGDYACGPGDGPAGGPQCCSVGYNCCFGHGVCCDENHPWLADGRCWRSDPGGASTICGKPAGF